jgi:creatinine amidohydrolase/Fe(II)-dependent formamide hydrolase-like protein
LNPWKIIQELDPQYRADGSDHGGFIETSMVLAFSPHTVDMKKAKPKYVRQALGKAFDLSSVQLAKYKGSTLLVNLRTKDVWPYGFTEGRLPLSRASAEEGRKMIGMIVDHLSSLIEELKKTSFSGG